MLKYVTKSFTCQDFLTVVGTSFMTFVAKFFCRSANYFLITWSTIRKLKLLEIWNCWA